MKCRNPVVSPRLWQLGVLTGLAAQLLAAAPESHQVPMRDGTRLGTDVYLPEGRPPFPVILLRSPYNKALGRDIGATGAKAGYATVIQDTRGRFGSEGENLPFHADGWAEHWDGFDTVEWVARQAWCNGKIGTFGGSALGITQLQVAGSGTDKLTCQHITVAAPNLYEGGIYRGGVFRKALTEDWLRVSLFSPEALKIWTAHPTYDAYWRGRDVTTRFRQINLPAVHIGGYFDIFAQGTIDAFLGYQSQGGPRARGQQKLLMGPWTHGVLTEKAGELTFPGAKRPPNGVHDQMRWFDYWLKGISNGIAGLPPVTYYVMGDVTDTNAPGNVWRTANQWPPLQTRLTRYYLQEDRTLSTTKPRRASSLTYTYNPQDPAPTVGGYELTLPAGPRDQRALENRPDVLVFTSDPLRAPLEVTGRVRARLYAASDAPDTDWLMKLCDVYPDGRSFNLGEGILRARCRKSLERERLLQPGHAERFDLDLWSTSIVFNRGHRLRVLLTSSSAPGYDPNPNTGAPFRSSDETRPARNTVQLSRRHPSHILLPIVPPAGAHAPQQAIRD
jgi:hypothetical protein